MLPDQTDAHSPEVLAAIRRGKLFGKALSVVMDVQPGEGLADVIFRAACENGYTNPRDILAMMHPRTQKTMSHGSFTKDDGLDPDRIADILGTPRGGVDIAPLMYPRRAANMISFFGVNLRKEHLRSAFRRVAPRSLSVRPYMKAAWALRPFTFDLDTRERLLDHCPVCHTKLSFVAARGVAGCGSCINPSRNNRSTVDLRDYPQPFIEVENEEGLRFLCGLVNPEPSAREFTSTRVAEELRAYPPGELFEFILYLAKALMPNVVKGPVGKMDRWDPLEPSFLADAGAAVMNWPRGFQDLSERLRLANGFKSSWSIENLSRSDTPNLGKGLKSLATLRAQEGLRRRTYERVRDQIEVQPAIVSRKPKQGVPLGFSQSSRVELSRLLRGELDELPTGAKLAQVVRSSSILQRLAKKTSIPTAFLPDLLLDGLLPGLDDDLSMLFPKARRDLPNLVERMTSVATKGVAPKEALPLLDAISALTTRRINPWPSILKAAFAGKLPLWVKDSKKQLLYSIYVADLEALKEILSDCVVRADLESVRLSGTEAAFVAAKSLCTLVVLRAGGILDREPSLGKLWENHERHILTKEIRVRFRMMGISLRNNDIAWELDTAGIPSIRTGLVCAYDRTAVERYYGARIMSREDQGVDLY